MMGRANRKRDLDRRMKEMQRMQESLLDDIDALLASGAKDVRKELEDAGTEEA